MSKNRPAYLLIMVPTTGTPRREDIANTSALHKRIAALLRDNPEAAFEVFEVRPAPSFEPTPTERAKARQRFAEQLAKVQAERIGRERARDAERLAALERERELLRLRLGVAP